jgi:hypothetical protein
LITRTAKGEHRFFRHPGKPVRNAARIRTGEGRIALEVRADGGFGVAPGSVHETGLWPSPPTSAGSSQKPA